MPTIPLIDPASGPIDGDFLTVLAIMCRPSDADIHRKVRLACEAEVFAQVCEEEGLPPDGVGLILPLQDFIALARAEPLEKLVELIGDSGFGGSVAGDLLLFVLNCAERAPEHASINKAIFVTMADLVGMRLHSGEKPPAGRSAVYDAWIEFKPVAHLWAAFRLWLNDFQQTPELDPRTPAGLLRFLAMAEELHARAVRVKARGRTDPVLDASETWRVPEALALPPITLQIPPLTEEAVAWLEEYTEARKQHKQSVK